MWIRAVVLSFALVGSGSAWALDADDCGSFKWSIARERAWLKADPAVVISGADAAMGAGFEVSLVPNDDAGFVAKPERAPKVGTFGGILKLTIPKAGTYHVTLSSEGWVDVVQNGAGIKSSDFSGQKNCPGIRKSVRFALAAGPATVQLSNIADAKIKVAIAPAE